ncbi:MAG: crossover junction endodeoxyribonuclease RuvC [Chloroflexi bacterium]|nr:crossover junction endodeoxyribonuclease RuvC [Chloroflexota bacterium]
MPAARPARALGIDPGTATTGYGVVETTQAGPRAIAYGVIRTPAGWTLARRLQSLHEQLNALIALHDPTTAAVEKLFFQKNVRTAMAVGQARGVALLALSEYGLAVGEYSPLEVKQAVTGYGAAGKRQVQQMVRAILELDDIPRPDDAADALAIAICHLQCSRLNELVEAS